MSEKGVSFSPDENQDSSGDLNSTFSPPDKDFEKSIEPLEIAHITHFSDIPDFIDPTRSPYPIIVQSPSSLQCIDGWEKIEQAKSQGERAITCEVIHVQRDSEINVAIWKASVRTMPLGGRCIYPEEVRNTCRLFMMLRRPSDSYVVFSHGGDRRGDGYKNCLENNIRLVLEDRLGKKPKTINKHLNHGQFISDEAIQDLIDARVKKGFFEAIQKDKQRLIDELTFEEKSPDEIVKAVSDKVLSRLEEFQTGGPAEIVIPQTDQEETPSDENRSQQNVVPPPSVKPIEHKHWPGNLSAAPEKQLTEDEICQEFVAIGQLLIETAENKALTIQERIQIFSPRVIRQPRLIQHLYRLLAKQSTNDEEQR
jgi:hypothetical protein